MHSPHVGRLVRLMLRSIFPAAVVHNADAIDRWPVRQPHALADDPHDFWNHVKVECPSLSLVRLISIIDVNTLSRHLARQGTG